MTFRKKAQRDMTRILTPLSLLFFSVTSFAVQVTELKVNNWSGGAYIYDDGSGRFSHCVVSTGYLHGGALYLGVLNDGTTVLGFEDDKWAFSPGSDVTGTVQVDDRYLKQFSTKAQPQGNLIYISYFGSDPVFESVRRGRTLTLEIDGEATLFDLTDTSTAFSMVKECVQQNQGRVFDPAGVGTSSAAAAFNLWLRENPWFSDPANNQERYDTVMRINQEMLDEGWDDTKISYYAEIDRRLEAEMARKASSRREKRPLSDFFKD